MPHPPQRNTLSILKSAIKILFGSIDHWTIILGEGSCPFLLPCFFPQMNDNFRHVLNYEAPLTAGNVGTCPRGALEQGHCHQGWSIELQIMEGILFSWQWLVLLNQNDVTHIPPRIFLAQEIRPARLFSLCNFANSADCETALQSFPFCLLPCHHCLKGSQTLMLSYWSSNDCQLFVDFKPRKLHSHLNSQLFCQR